MKYDNAIDHWTTQFFNRFKKSINVFMNIIFKEKYTMKDVRRCRKFRKYVAICQSDFDIVLLGLGLSVSKTQDF